MEEQAKNLRDHLPSRPSAAAAAPHERLTELWRFAARPVARLVSEGTVRSVSTANAEPGTSGRHPRVRIGS